MTDIQPPPAPWRRRELQGIPDSLEALWTRRGDEGWHYGLQLREGHANAQGFVHGGVLMTFMDHALSLLAWEASGRAACIRRTGRRDIEAGSLDDFHARHPA